MGSTTTQTTIANRALQLLGYQPISLITENSRGAKAMNRAYPSVFLSELRANFWSFSIMRAVLAASTTTPLFGKGNYFPLPPGFVMIAPPDQYTSYTAGPSPVQPFLSAQGTDWQIENDGTGILCIVTDQPAPLNVRFVSSNVTEALFDYNFAEALSASLALETCEELTQSNTKLQNIAKIYDDAMETAKKRNSFERQPLQPRIDPWILVRR